MGSRNTEKERAQAVADLLALEGVSSIESLDRRGNLDQSMAGTILAVFHHYWNKWRKASGGELANEITYALRAAGFRRPVESAAEHALETIRKAIDTEEDWYEFGKRVELILHEYDSMTDPEGVRYMPDGACREERCFWCGVEEVDPDNPGHNPEDEDTPGPDGSVW